MQKSGATIYKILYKQTVITVEQLAYNNIFDAITEDKAEAADLKFRSDLMLVMRQIFDDRGWSQADIMAALDIPQPRVSELARGKVDKFSSDKLIGYLAKLGFQFRPTYQSAKGRHVSTVKCAVSAA